MFLTGTEDKPTGKQLFEKNKLAFEDLTLDEAELEALAEETKDAENEEDEEVGDFHYDRALYDDGLVGEDVDFDWTFIL